VLEEAQPLRLGYASHALKLQGGQAAVVLVLPGGWQTSRQSAYSMATRCVEELHVFVDAETQQSGLYRDSDPIHALGERWMRAAGKLVASIQRNHQPRPDGPAGRSRVDPNLVVLPPAPWELAANRAPELAGGARSPTDSASTCEPDSVGITFTERLSRLVSGRFLIDVTSRWRPSTGRTTDADVRLTICTKRIARSVVRGRPERQRRPVKESRLGRGPPLR